MSKASRQRWWWDSVSYSRFCCFSVCVGRVSESWQLIHPCVHEDKCASLVPALQLSHGSCFKAQDGGSSSHNTGSLGYCCWNLCLWHQGSLGTTSAADGERFGGVDGSVDHYSLWSRISRQHNSALHLRKCWLHGVNKVVTYPCPSSFTCTFWSIMHIAFCLLLPCESQSQ